MAYPAQTPTAVGSSPTPSTSRSSPARSASSRSSSSPATPWAAAAPRPIPPPSRSQPLDPQAIDFDNPVTVESAPDPTAPRDPTAPAPIVTNFDPIDVQTPSNPQPGLARPIDVVNAPREDPNTSFHEVVSGDTIYDLALALGSSVDAIMQANGLSEFDTLHIGQILVVPLIEEDDDEATAAATTSDP